MVDLTEGEWLEANRATWDERVPVHLASDFYDQSKLREGAGELGLIEEAELAELLPKGWQGKRVLHLQCHFGADTLVLAQRGATVVGLDFSKPAVVAARQLAAEIGLDDRARFIHANLYDARHMLPEPESFDVVYTTWGTIGWLPDVAEWARIIAWYLKPGGRLYFADGHPTAWMFDEIGANGETRIAFPYTRDGEPDVTDDPGDYADESAVLSNSTVWEWMHPVGEVVTALVDAGLTIEYLHEHYEVPWKIFPSTEQTRPGLWGWPGIKWVPLGLSIAARA